jgi:hypothetical protein
VHFYPVSHTNGYVVKIWHHHDLYRPEANLAAYQRGVYYARIQLHNKDPFKIACLFTNSIQFKTTTKEFLITHSFYSSEEFILQSTLVIADPKGSPKIMRYN